MCSCRRVFGGNWKGGVTMADDDIIEVVDEEDEGFVGFEDEDDFDEDEDDFEDGISAVFDYEDMRVKVDAVGRVNIGDEMDALRFWVTKCLLTERYNYLAYDTDFGVQFEELIRSNPDRDIAESEIIREIDEALGIDDRIESVDDFDFSWMGSHVYVTFSINTVYEQEEITLEMDGENIEQSRVSFTSLS